MIGKLISLVVGAVFVGALAGTAVTAILNVDTSGWGSAAPVWLVIPIAIVAGIAILILKEIGIDVTA
jgi:hypothetical protein